MLLLLLGPPLAHPKGEGRERGPFVESLLSRLRMHWDHEPTPNPSQEGNSRRVDDCLLPSWEGSGVGRFMESQGKLIDKSVPVV